MDHSQSGGETLLVPTARTPPVYEPLRALLTGDRPDKPSVPAWGRAQPRTPDSALTGGTMEERPSRPREATLRRPEGRWRLRGKEAFPGTVAERVGLRLRSRSGGNHIGSETGPVRNGAHAHQEE